MLESRKHAASCFVTLTYDQEHLPPDGSVQPRDATLWLKRLRRRLAPIPIRYYLCGEYGDSTWRPHYHAALFGVGPEAGSEVQQAWGMGHTMTGPLARESCQYIAGYVTKKLTKASDIRLGGRAPEFARMSLRPGIGATAMEDVGSALNSSAGAALISSLRDVPIALQSGQSSMPLGRYLRARLRDVLGLEVDPHATTQAQALATEMRDLREKVGRATFAVCKPMVEHQKIRQIEAKARIYASRKTL